MSPINEKNLTDLANVLFRTPNGWPSMEQRHKTGTPRNLIFLPPPDVGSKELIEAMRESFKTAVREFVDDLKH